MFFIEHLRKRIFDWTFYCLFILYHVGKNIFSANLNYSKFMSVVGMYKALITSAIEDIKILVEICSLPWFKGFSGNTCGKTCRNELLTHMHFKKMV